jgi:hypothetical protein
MASTAGQRSARAVTERTTVSLDDFQAEMIRLDGAVSDTESANICVFGDSNAGKTVLAGSLPRNTFWLVCEPGFKSAARWRAQKGAPPHRGARPIRNSAEALTAIDWLNAGDRAKKLDWLVLDGASNMQERIRLSYAQEAFDIDPSKRQHRNLPDRPDYFNTQNFMFTWMSHLIDLPVNLLVTAHAYRTDKTDNGDLIVYAGFQGKVNQTSNSITGLMDVTAYMESKRVRIKGTEQSRTMRTLWFASPTGRKRDEEDVRYIVGDKFNCLGERMDNPTMPRIMQKINGEGND